VLAGLIPGHTRLNASKEDAFYPNTWGTFWDGEGTAEVEVPNGGEISGILLRLAPAARVEVHAIDAITGAAVGQITVHLEREGNPRRFLTGTKLSNGWLVPTVPILLQVRANGCASA
jgi:hypothetical protein